MISRSRFASTTRVVVFAAAFSALALAASASQAGTVSLYDPLAGTLPIDQGWLPFVFPPVVESHSGGLVELDTTADRAAYAGYFSEQPSDGLLQHPQMPVLDRATGYTVSFDLQVLAEGHNTRDDNGDGLDDRAGFSVIAISQDLLGLELAFFEDRVWAYAAAGEGPNSQFTQAEGVAIDTTAAVTRYDLVVQGATYTLLAGGAPILGGPLRNYNPSGVTALIDPYDNPSFLFFGDDTTSAESHVLLGEISVTLVPEPACGLLAALALPAVMIARRRGAARQRRSRGKRP